MMEYAEKLETDQKDFILKDFLNKFNMAGSIPVELIRFELMNE